MKCPYYGVECYNCSDECCLDRQRRDPISGRLVIPLGKLNAEKEIFKKTTIVLGAIITTMELPTSGYITQWTISDAYWDESNLKEALKRHEYVCTLARVRKGREHRL